MKIYNTNLYKKLEFSEDYYIEYDYIKKDDIYKKDINFGNNKSKCKKFIDVLNQKGYKYYYDKYEC